MKVKLNNVRLSFAQLFEAKTVNGEGKPAFSASFICERNRSTGSPMTGMRVSSFCTSTFSPV